MKESTITNKTLGHLTKVFGGHWWKQHGSRYSRGYPDIMGCVGGRFVGVEMKTPERRGEVSELQALRLRDLAAAGGIAGVATSAAEAEGICRAGGLTPLDEM